MNSSVVRKEAQKPKPFQSLTEEEKRDVLKWRNHPDVRERMFSTHEIQWEEHIRFIEGLSTDAHSMYWLLPEKGVISLRSIDRKNGNAYLGIYKNPFSQEKGIAEELMRSLLEIVFDELRLHTLKLSVFSDNPRAVTFYNKCGFNQEGRLREFYRKNDGTFADLILMGITEQEYRPESDVVI